MIRPLLILMIALLPARGIAGSKAETKARALFEKGVKMAKEKQWNEALEAFQASSDLVPRESTSFNIGFALFQLNRFVEAVDTFSNYLERADETKDQKRRARAKELIAKAKASVAVLELTLLPEGAQLSIDGRLMKGEGGQRTLRLDPGIFNISLIAEGYEPHRETLRLEPGDRLSKQLSLRAVPKPDLGPVPTDPVKLVKPEVTVGPEQGAFFEGPWFWIIAGAVVVGAGVALGVAFAPRDQDPVGGSSGVVIDALRAR